MGSSARRLSGTDGRRLRPRRRAVSIVSGAPSHGEAHTFLGWTYHFQGRIEEAIAECKLAIGLDPEFGNPYNDIGAYLIELGRFEEAIPWLEQPRRRAATSRVTFRTTTWAAPTLEKRCTATPYAASRKRWRSSRATRWLSRLFASLRRMVN